jgi:methionyl-tRNA formyltransferase
LKIVVFMNGDRGYAVLGALTAPHLGYDVIGVPDKDVNAPEFIDTMIKYQPDLFIVAGYSRIFKKNLLSVPKLGTWNCHAGPVPEYRGGSPLNWQIIDGADWIGLSVLQMDEGIDTGPVLQTATFPLGSTQTIKDAHDLANKTFPLMILKLLEIVETAGEVVGLTQPDSDAYRKQRSDRDGEISFLWPAEKIHNYVRALTHPYPGAWFMRHGRKIRIWSTSVE